MGPRKKAKPNPKAETSGPTQPDPKTVPLPREPSESEGLGSKKASGESGLTAEASAKADAATPSSNQGPKTQSTKAWYGGTWPRAPKAAPIAQIAKEGITTATGVLSSLADVTTSSGQQASQALMGPRKSSLYLSRTLESSTRSLLLSAAPAKANIPSSGLSRPLDATESSGKAAENKQSKDASKITPAQSDKDVKEAQFDGSAEVAEKGAEPESLNAVVRGANLSSQQYIDRQTGWLGWFSQAERLPSSSQPPIEDASRTDIKHGPSPSQKPIDAGEGSVHGPEKRRNSDPSPRVVIDEEGKQHPRSWLGLWGTSTAAQDKNDLKSGTKTRPQESSDTSKQEQDKNDSKSGTNTLPQGLSDTSKQDPAATVLQDQSTAGTTNVGGWAFWSRSAGIEDSKDGRSNSVFGELAVASSAPQIKAKTAAVDGGKGETKTISKSGEVQKSRKLEANGEAKQPSKGLKSGTTTTTKVDSVLSLPTKINDSENSPKQKAGPKNLILPSFRNTFCVPENQGFLQKIGNLLYRTTPSEPKHVSLLRDPPRIRRALAIGVHGYFPAPLLRSVLGQPTGTSIRFADHAANAIHKWTSRAGYSCKVEKIALEGEGKIEERVDLLWKLMLNWLDEIRKADFILIACHSQGVPVAIMLVAKLVAFGCLNGARIGVCAMAGVNLGPFTDYKSRWISGSAGELFDFANAKSKVSKDYNAALDTVLKFGVRVLYIGSIDDQLVSLEVRTLPQVT